MDFIRKILATQPILFTRVISSVAALAIAFGAPITENDIANAVEATAMLFALGNVLFALVERQTVYSPATTQKIADRASATGNTDIGEPPTGDLTPVGPALDIDESEKQ